MKHSLKSKIAAAAASLALLGGGLAMAAPAQAGTPMPTKHESHSRSVLCLINFNYCRVKSHCWYEKRAANAGTSKPVVFKKCDAWWG